MNNCQLIGRLVKDPEMRYTINIGDYIVIEDGYVEILNVASFGFLYDEVE